MARQEMMSRSILGGPPRCAMLTLLLVSGCGFQTSMKKEFITTAVGRTPTKPLKESKLWIRSFTHKRVSEVSSAFVAGPRGSASGIAVTRSTADEAPYYVVQAAQRMGVFGSVTPIALGEPCDLILEGSVDASWNTPWWTWVQLLDVWVHAWFLPTLGRSLDATVELRLFDKEYQFIRSWRVNYRKKYIGQIWWMWGHGGAYDLGKDVQMQQEVIEYAFEQLRPQLNQLNGTVESRRGVATDTAVPSILGSAQP